MMALLFWIGRTCLQRQALPDNFQQPLTWAVNSWFYRRLRD